jgi:hypothetical protein
MNDFNGGQAFGRSEISNFESSAKFRTLAPRGENSPQGNRLYLNTPFFHRENTDYKDTYSGHSVKEFSLGKPQK